MAACAEVQTRAISQVVHTMKSISSLLRVITSAKFVYTPSNASSLQDLDFKLELIKVSRATVSLMFLQFQMQIQRWSLAANDDRAGLSAKLLQ